MNSYLNHIYQYSPYTIQNLFVYLRGMQLKKLRYGWVTEKLVKEAEEREYWSQNQWKDWQKYHLDKILNAARKTPYYMEPDNRIKNKSKC